MDIILQAYTPEKKCDTYIESQYHDLSIEFIAVQFTPFLIFQK